MNEPENGTNIFVRVYNAGYGFASNIKVNVYDYDSNTSPPTIKAAKGDIIEVEPTALIERADGRIIW